MPYRFWRRLLEFESLVAIKIAPFNRYQTIDVLRAVISSQRADVALYTGNDDNIVLDLLTPYRLHLRMERGFRATNCRWTIGQWAVWTKRSVELLQLCQRQAQLGTIPSELLRLNIELTDANAALFDAAMDFVVHSWHSRGPFAGKDCWLVSGAWMNRKRSVQDNRKRSIESWRPILT